MYHDQQRSTRGILNELPDLLDKRRLVQILRVHELDLFVLEPLARINEHAEAQGGLNLGVEGAESEHCVPILPEPPFERSFIGLRYTVSDKKESVGVLFSQLCHRHTSERKSLGGSQRCVRRLKQGI